jgi:hypothetical protein
MSRHSIKAWLSEGEKEAVTALAVQMGRTESWVIRRAVALYAQSFGTGIALQDRRRGAVKPVPAATRERISRTKVAKNAERREARP